MRIVKMENNNVYCTRNKKVEYLILQLLDFVSEYQPNLLTFPLDIKSIILLMPQYRVWTYERHSLLLNQDVKQTESFCQSKTGCTFCNDKNQYIILYNNKMPIGRQRFTLAHELGHCILSHFDTLSLKLIAENGTGNNINKVIEYEADYFASTLLCPFPLCKKINITSPLDIQHIFGLSSEAAYYRYSNYLIWKDNHFKTAFDSDIVKYFNAFVNDR